jgi:hypothetical protein
MAVTTPHPRLRPDRAASTNGSGAAAAAAAAVDLNDPRDQAFALLRAAFTVAPALRDFGLMLGALTLARLAVVYDAPRRQR